MKNRIFRLAVWLFAATALSGSFISGTFAKYAVKDSSSDSARVAKWGITVFAEGSLFGDQYSGKTNAIIENDDGSITVKSHHEASLFDGNGHIVAPGTKNDTGLRFGFNGTAEVAVKVEATVKDQNIVLRPGIFYFMHRITETITDGNFSNALLKYGRIYVQNGTSYRKITTFESASAYYYVDNEVDLTNVPGMTWPYYWPYCPVVFQLNPTETNGGLYVRKDANAAFLSSGSYKANSADKNLDIIAWTYCYVGFGNRATILPKQWPDLEANNVFTRTVSATFQPGQDLAKISRDGDTRWRVNDETLTWEWAFEQEINRDLYNAADNILGRLSAEKIAKAKDSELIDDFVVCVDRTYSYNSDGQLVFDKDGFGDGSVLIRPEEYTDYCLETMFDIELKISQVD